MEIFPLKWPSEAKEGSFTRGHSQQTAAPNGNGRDKQEALIQDCWSSGEHWISRAGKSFRQDILKMLETEGFEYHDEDFTGDLGGKGPINLCVNMLLDFQW